MSIDTLPLSYPSWNQCFKNGIQLALFFVGYLIEVMLKISRRQTEEYTVEFALSGRLQFKHINELRTLIRKEEHRVVLDLREVNLLDREAVGFLVACEGDGVSLRNCSPYIREWINREAGRQNFPSPEEAG